MTSGIELPVRQMSPPVGSETLRTASPDYVGTDDQQQDEYDPDVMTIRRVADGLTVSTLDITNVTSHYEPWLAGGSLLTFVLIGTSANGHDQLQVHDSRPGR